jgi:transcriptional regulator with XRE-family HTH domain
MASYEPRTPLLESLIHIRVKYFRNNAAEMGRILNPPLSKTQMSRIMKGESRPSAQRLGIALIELGYNEEFLFYGKGEPREDEPEQTSQPGGNIIMIPVAFKGQPMNAVLIVTQIQKTQDGVIAGVEGKFHLVPAPVEEIVGDEE